MFPKFAWRLIIASCRAKTLAEMLPRAPRSKVDDSLGVRIAAPARGPLFRPVRRPALWAALLVAALATLIPLRELHGAANFDEGVYLNSLRALQRGAPLGRQVFASQPPGYYLLLRLDALIFPGSLTGLRLGFAALGLAGCLSVFALGRLYAGVLGGTMAALLFVAAAPVVGLTSRVSPDLAGVSLSLVGIALLVNAWHGAVSRRWLGYLAAFAGGAALAAAITMKLDGVIAVFAVCVLAALLRPNHRLLLASFGGLVVTLACVLAPFAAAASQLWRSVVSFHLGARGASFPGGTSGPRANAEHIVSAFHAGSNPIAWLMLIGASALLVYGGRGTARNVLWLLVWPLATVAFLLWQTPLFDHHVVLLAGAAAIPAGVGFAYAARDSRRWRRFAVVVATAAALAAFAQSATQPAQPEPKAVTKAVSMLREKSRPGSYVVATDLPIVAFLAHRPVPPDMVDTSWVRLLAGLVTRREILAQARSHHVAAVLAGPRLLSSAATRGALNRQFPHRIHIDTNSTLYLPAGGKGG